MTPPPTLYSPFQIGVVQLKNRVVALPVFTGYAYPDGTVSPFLLAHYSNIAASGAAMVVVANVAVSAQGTTSRYNLRIDADRYIPGLKDLADAIRRQGARACIQLNHAGRYAKTTTPLLASPVDTRNLGYNLSALKDAISSFPLEQRFALASAFIKQITTWQRETSDAELSRVVKQFGQATRRAQQAGFEMIELHGANGYLLCDFLSPATNKRSSGFGGSFENRLAWPLKVVHEMRSVLPADIPLGFRIVLREWVPGGIGLNEAITLARILEEAGVDYLSAAAGTFNSFFRPQVSQIMSQSAYLYDEMAALNQHVTIATIISGRVTTPALADRLLRHGVADLIGLGRALRVDPAWLQKAGDPHRKIKTCVNCNFCLKQVILEQGFNCQRWPKVIQDKTKLQHMLLTRNDNSLWVIANAGDLKRFQNSIPALLPAGCWQPPQKPPTLLFLQNHTAAGCSDQEKSNFLAWMRTLAPTGQKIDPPSTLEKALQGTWEKTVLEESVRGDFGHILIGRASDQHWRERLLYALRHKVVALITPNMRMHEVAVLLDFSVTSALVMTYVKRAYANQSDFRLHFIHAFEGRKALAQRHWATLKKVTEWPMQTPLKLIPVRGDLIAAIMAEITITPYGTIIMGKRGLSGIKRMLLGSVSRAVLNRTDDHCLVLVD